MIPRLRRFRAGAAGGSITGPALRWSQLSTWGGSFPAQGVPLFIGQPVIFDVALDDSNAPGLITIQPGGSLTVDSALDTRLVCDGIYVNGGQYIVGTASVAHPAKHWIDLCGAIPTVSGNPGGGPLVRGPTHTGAKAGVSTGNNGTTNDNMGVSRGFIVDAGGTINLYGQPGTLLRRLNAHYASGTTLTLDAPVTAKAGDTVLISPTGFFNTSRRTEKRTLAADVNNSATITINTALGYARWGLLQYATDSGITTSSGQPWTLKTGGNPTGMRTSSLLTPDVDNVIDQRAVVAIMNRSIRIQGYDRAGGNTSLVSAGFGFHGMTMDLDTETVIKNVEMVNYGQLGLLGRYGWHFHHNSYNFGTTGAGAFRTDGVLGSMGPTSGGGPNFPPGKALVQGCTGRGGFNRFFTFHACRGVSAIDNIAYDSAGHTFFEEDGPEEDNTSLRNTAIAPRDPGSTYRLKGHDFNAAGHWIANFNNHHEDLLGVDCEFIGVWNAPSGGFHDDDSFNPTGTRGDYLANPTTASGCLGSSSNVPLFPNFAKFGVWKNCGGFVCGMFGVQTFRTTNANTGEVVSVVPFNPFVSANGLPRGDSDTLPLPLEGITAYKCTQGGYFNSVFTPGYKNARMADNGGQGFAGTTRPDNSTNSFPLLVRESLNHESHALSGTIGAAVASYHGDLQHVGVMAWNYSGGSVGILPGTPFKGADGLIGRNCVLSGYDLYDNALDELSIPHGQWALYNSSGFWHTPGPALMNDVTSYNTYNGGVQYNEAAIPAYGGGTLPNRGGRACVYDRWGNLSQGPTQAGVPCGYIVYNQPFWTTGLTTTTLEENHESVVTTTPFFGIEPRCNDISGNPPGNHWGFATQFSRLDSSGAAISGAVNNFRDAQVGDPDTGLGSHYTSAPKDGIVYWHHPSLAKNTTVVGLAIRKVSYLLNPLYGSATDAVTIVVDWDGTIPARVFATTELNAGSDYNAGLDTQVPPKAKEYSSLGSRAALLATTTAVWNFWQDTANDKVWIRYRPHQHTLTDYFDAGPPQNAQLTANNNGTWLIVKPL